MICFRLYKANSIERSTLSQWSLECSAKTPGKFSKGYVERGQHEIDAPQTTMVNAAEVVPEDFSKKYVSSRLRHPVDGLRNSTGLFYASERSSAVFTLPEDLEGCGGDCRAGSRWSGFNHGRIVARSGTMLA